MYIGGSNHESIELKTVRSIRTDFSEGDSYQKVVRFSSDGSRLVTGGCDGVVRVWKVHSDYIGSLLTCDGLLSSILV